MRMTRIWRTPARRERGEVRGQGALWTARWFDDLVVKMMNMVLCLR
jgi:hypothetical protein